MSKLMHRKVKWLAEGHTESTPEPATVFQREEKGDGAE